MRNLAAYTLPSGQYPPFVSINLLDNDKVRITVRAEPYHTKFKPGRASDREPWLVVGNEASIELNLHDFRELLRQLSANIGETM